MKLQETNLVLRGMVNRLIYDIGWVKTQIGRILLGSNGQAHMNHWMKEKDDGESNDFGIKPLSKIAEIIDYEVHIVFVKNDEKRDQVTTYLDNLNNDFIKDLEESIDNALKNNIQTPRMSKSHRGQIDNVLDELLGIEPEGENNIDSNTESNLESE